MDVTEAIAPLEPGYAALLARVVEAVQPDPRVRALWLAVADPAAWAVVDPVITIPIPGMPGCFAFTTREGLRVDVVLESPTGVAGSPYTQRVRVLDRDGLEPPTVSAPARGPDVEKMQRLVTEFLRQSAIFPAAVVARGDWLLGQEAVHNYRWMLYDLLTESNQPLPVTGVKQWSSRLTADQLDLLVSLPVPTAHRESVVAAKTATRAAIRTHGRAALERSGGVWPTEVDDAMAAYWARHRLP